MIGAWRRARGAIGLVGAGVLLLVGANGASAQRVIVPFATGEIVDNRVRVGGADVERVSGSVWGVGAATQVSPLFAVRARVAGGRLTGRTPATEDRGYSLAELAVVITADRWLTVEVGPVTRVLATSMVRQRWTEMRIGSTIGIELLDNTLRGTVRAAVSPLLSVSGQPSPDLALATGTGLEYSDGRLTAALDYNFERYDFPSGQAGRRLEQRATLTAKVGWTVPWKWPL